MNSILRGQRAAVLVLTTMLGACHGQPVAPPQSLAPNSSFERGEGGKPADWSFYSWEGAEGWWDDKVAHSGSRSVGLRGINGGWSATAPVEAGKVHNIKLHYRAQGGPSRIVLYVRVPTGPREMDTILYLPKPTVAADAQGRFVAGEYVEADRGWVLFSGGDFIPEPGVEAVDILIKLRATDAEAQAWLDDIIVTAAEPRRVPVTARLLRAVPGGKVWTDSENRKILPEQRPPSGDPVEAVEIAAAKGEYESFQVAVTPEAGWRQVNWTCGDFAGPAALPKSAIRCRRVETVNIDNTMGPHGHKGLNPDPLTDRLPCDVPAGTNQAFWFTVRVPEEQTAGAYESQLALTAGGRTVCRVPLRLHVRNFAIPPRPSVDVKSQFRASIALAVESGERNEVLKRYYRGYFAHRSRCAPGVSVGVRVQGDTALVDAEEYVAHLRFMRDELGATEFDIPSLWISHRGTHKMPPDAEWQGRSIFANAELTRLNPEFERPFRSYMGRLVRRLKEEGLFLSPGVRFFDEPNFQDTATVNGLRALASLMLDIEPELTVGLAATYPHPELTDVIRLWVIHTDAWHRELRHIEAPREAGCRILVYNNAVNYPEHRPIRVRLWPWLLRKYGVDGTYSWWGTVCWRGEMADPWTAGRGNSGVLLYPPRSPDEHGPIDSVRWELFREGLEDYEYMHLAEELAAKLEAAGKPDAARPGRAAVAAALELVDRWPNVRAANDEPYTLDVTAVARAREDLAGAIEGMQEQVQ
ncbi:MAG: DUF6067 family protein [Armatimonadota bacterium]|jgi:hypothetical protein